MKKIISIVGARPNFIKLAMLERELQKKFIHIIVHTGQHYDHELSKSLFDDLKLPAPKYNLNVGSATPSVQISSVLAASERVLLKEMPDLVLVYGDTNSTLGGALAASKNHIPIAHIEAGERTFDKEMPEEINRIICDHISTINFCSTKLAVNMLKKEGINKNVYFTGDLMLDLLWQYKDSASKLTIKVPSHYILATIHREENTNNLTRLEDIVHALSSLNIPVVWPIHPRTLKAMREANVSYIKNIRFVKPLPYSQMVLLEKKSRAIITDSGGIQKEAYWLSIPCITIATATAWKQTLKGNWNRVTGKKFTKTKIKKLLSQSTVGKPLLSEFGNAQAAKKTADLIDRYI